MTKTGIDLSSWNRIDDYSKIKSGGIDFAILREGFSRTTDSSFLHNAEKLPTSGIDILGIYHFSYALNINQAVDEAKFAVQNAKQAGLDPESCIIFFDLEYDSVNYAQKHGVVIDKDDCIKYTTAFCDQVRQSGYKAGVYLNEDYRLHMYTDDILSKYICWYANWSTTCKLPALSSLQYHQYSATGQVPGIRGYVDMNRQLGEDQLVAKKDDDAIVAEVIAGKWGTGESRRKRLTAAGYDYAEIQAKVNAYLEANKKSGKKTLDDIAREVIAGKWNSGAKRKQLLEEAGYNFFEIQDRVNEILNS